eukprot:SAG31_NODE_25196_length_466_cov_0.866485_1_plen_124_part_01
MANLALPFGVLMSALGGLSGAGSRLAFEAVTVIEHPEFGVLTGTATEGPSASQVVLDPIDLGQCDIRLQCWAGAISTACSTNEPDGGGGGGGAAAAARGGDSCQYTNDGECDVPEYCSSGDYND